MPLPPAPTKRAALLTQTAYDAPARSAPKPARRTDKDVDAHPLARHTQSGDAPREHVARAPQRPDTAHAVPHQAFADKGDSASHVVAPSHQDESAPRSTRAAPKAKKAKSTGPTKLFVLDTNVLMHDPMCLFRFEEHDIFLPMIVLEELDGHKKGMTEVARNARQTSRSLDALAGSNGADIGVGLQLATTGHREAKGKLFFQTQTLDYALPASLPQGKADNQILGVVDALRVRYAPREVVLVSKDINMRVKARALGLATDDYQNDKTLDDGDLLYAGSMALPADFLGHPWTNRRKLAAGRAHLLPHYRSYCSQSAGQPVRVF